MIKSARETVPIAGRTLIVTIQTIDAVLIGGIVRIFSLIQV